MAQLPGGSYNAEDHGEMRNFEALPEDSYLLMITNSEMKPTKAGTGEYLVLYFDILTPEFTGRKLTVNLNLNNPNAQAVDIANRELGAICRAVGKIVIQDSSELHGIPFTGHLMIEPARPAVEESATTKARKGYPASNYISSYERAGVGGAPVAGAAAPHNPAAAFAADNPAPAPDVPAKAPNPPAAGEVVEGGPKPPWG